MGLLVLYDSLTRAKQELPPPPGPIRMYVCGPTVYQRIHVGNARPYVVFLWLKRWLELGGYDVTLVENVTDVNDKIYEAAEKQGIGSAELAEAATRWYLEDTDALGLDRPDHEPLASETIPEIVALIEELVGLGLAYESQGDVYFRVAAYPEYGQLSGAKLEDMVAQEPSDLKEDQRDFALWKATKPHEDTSWPSPWGPGRPGWHIECSAMAEKLLGPVFEIHGGGIDLRFPHHENELAQSRGAGREFAKLWAHNGLLELAQEKMSKSLGNIVSLRDALETYGREAILLLFLGAHYRRPVEYSDEAMQSARSQAATFRSAFRHPLPARGEARWEDLAAALAPGVQESQRLGCVEVVVEGGHRDELRRGLEIFGLGDLAVDPEPSAEAIALRDERQLARDRRDFGEADRLREELERLGWRADDTAEGTVLYPLE